MADRTDPVVVIVDGGLAGLTASWSVGVVAGVTAGHTRESVCWMPPDQLEARETRRRFAERQAQICGMGGLVVGQAMTYDASQINARADDTAESARVAAGMAISATLLSACAQAMALGIGRVIWPVHQGGRGATGPFGAGDVDLEWMSETTDRALLAGQLASVDVSRVRRTVGATGSAGFGSNSGVVRVETPYADFSDAELLDLAIDMDVPLAAAWWCQREAEGSAGPCGTCPSCERWRAALGVVDPQSLLDAQRLFGGMART